MAAWCGIVIDEGQGVGGPHGPYRQSERKPLYRQYADQLLTAGHAYYAFDTAEDLDAMRARLQAAKVPNPQYNAITRAQMREIAEKKIVDLNCASIESAVAMIEGSARSMGLEVVG